MYPKGLAKGECIQRPPGKEVQIPKGKRQSNATAKAMAEAKAMANGKHQMPA